MKPKARIIKRISG